MIPEVKPITVKKMYDYTSHENKPLLSNYDSAFWSDYVNHYADFDRMFMRLFKRFCYMEQDYDDVKSNDGVEIVTEDFITDVRNFLMMNNKKYSELYKIQLLNNAYNITDDYDVTEIMDRDKTSLNENTYGERTDTKENISKTHTDNKSDSLGTYTDTTQKTIGAHTDNETENLGSFTDSAQKVTGAQSNSTTNTLAGFNSSGFENDNKSDESLGSRTDSETDTISARNNTYSKSYGQHVDNDSFTKGAQNNTSSMVYGEHETDDEFTKGEQSDTLSGTSTEDYELHKYGRVGGSAVDNMRKHENFWNSWSLYEKIFKDIARYLLLIDETAIITQWYSGM